MPILLTIIFPVLVSIKKIIKLLSNSLNTAMKINSIQPRFKENYDVGYIGFTYNKSNLTSIGIAYFTDWVRMSDIKVSHCFIITGEDELIEASAKEGVRKNTISKYFNDPNVQVFFRKPKIKSPKVTGEFLSLAAKAYRGYRYNYFAILIQSLYGNKTLPAILGLVGISHNSIRMALISLFEPLLEYFDHGFICSGLVARVLIITNCFYTEVPYNLISPQELFESAKPFYPWKGSVVVKSR